MSEGGLAAEAGDRVRANTYSLLAALLAVCPSEEVLQRLREIEPGEFDSVEFGSRRSASGDKNDGWAATWEVLRLAGERAEGGALDDEYHALFIGVGRGELVPYGSWYMTGFMMDQPLAILRGDLARLGFERQTGVHEPEDHAAALCETMSLIIGSADIDMDRQRKFYNDHIGPWMGTFFLDLQRAKSARFYRAVGQFGHRFVEFEKQYLGMLA